MNDKRINSLALIIGVMKCGTTSLFRYLEQHPQICPCSVKEPGFFSDDRTYARGLHWYYGLWDRDPSVYSWALEASTGYSHPRLSGKFAQRIAATGADIRIICMVRDPVKRIESHYNHAHSAGWLLREVNIDDLIEQRPNIIDFSRYALQLDPYRQVFGRDRILVINASDLSDDPSSQMDRIVDFLGLNQHAFDRLAELHNPGRGRIVDAELLTRVRQHRGVRETLLRVVPPNMQYRIRQALGTRLTEPFRLSSDSRSRIMALLDDDLKRLKEEYGVDISGWGIEVKTPAGS